MRRVVGRPRVQRQYVAVLATVIAVAGAGIYAAVPSSPSRQHGAAIQVGHSSSPSSGARNPNPFAGRTLYVQPTSPIRGLSTRQRGLIAKINDEPQAVWFGSGVSTGALAGQVAEVTTRAATSHALPVLVAYNIPVRDCGHYSYGGANGGAAYLAWIRQFALGLGDRPAAVILEPDALAAMSCLTSQQRQQRYALLSAAVKILRHQSGTSVYLDAGNALWTPARVIVQRLRWAGIADANGFSLNVANFDDTTNEENYGKAISAQLDGEHFVIDTSRNGRGAPPGNAWCNPPGRALGTPPTTSTGDPHTDALLWIKHPGFSDGSCGRGEPAAGSFWPPYAAELAQRATW